MPPYLPQYPLGDTFADLPDFIKTLLFSGWRMVLRAVASLLSYEAERRRIGDAGSRTPQKRGKRRYFRHTTDRPHRAAQLRFIRRDGEPAKTTNFALVYASPTLAATIGSAAAAAGTTTAALEAAIAEECWRRFAELSLGRFAETTGAAERWYRAAPVLLNMLDPHRRPTVGRGCGTGPQNRARWVRQPPRGRLQRAPRRAGLFFDLGVSPREPRFTVGSDIRDAVIYLYWVGAECSVKR